MPITYVKCGNGFSLSVLPAWYLFQHNSSYLKDKSVKVTLCSMRVHSVADPDSRREKAGPFAIPATWCACPVVNTGHQFLNQAHIHAASSTLHPGSICQGSDGCIDWNQSNSSPSCAASPEHHPDSCSKPKGKDGRNAFLDGSAGVRAELYRAWLYHRHCNSTYC